MSDILTTERLRTIFKNAIDYGITAFTAKLINDQVKMPAVKKYYIVEALIYNKIRSYTNEMGIKSIF